MASAQHPAAALPHVLSHMARLGSDCMALPFDMAREQYAKAVRAGLVERSMLRSAQFERTLRAMESLSLGYMARSR